MDESIPKICRKGNDSGKVLPFSDEWFSNTLLNSLQDSTFEFEKRRNRPVKYSRETMESTLQAMKKVSEIQSKRQEMFFKMRMRAHKVTQREIVKAEIKNGIEILAPAAADRERALALATKTISVRQRKQEAQLMN